MIGEAVGAAAIVGVPLAIVQTKELVTTPKLLLATMEAVPVPALVGVPVMVPRLVLMAKPPGRPVALKLIGPGPVALARAPDTAVPTAPSRIEGTSASTGLGLTDTELGSKPLSDSVLSLNPSPSVSAREDQWDIRIPKDNRSLRSF